VKESDGETLAKTLELRRMSHRAAGVPVQKISTL